MAGKIRSKFVDIISDKFTEHYRGSIAEQDLDKALKELSGLVARLDNSKKDGKSQRAETLRKLKRLPLEKLQEILSAEA